MDVKTSSVTLVSVKYGRFNDNKNHSSSDQCYLISVTTVLMVESQPQIPAFVELNILSGIVMQQGIESALT